MPNSDEVIVQPSRLGAVVPWISNQARGCVEDPLGYAIEKWMYLIFFGLGISILGGTAKWLYRLVVELF